MIDKLLCLFIVLSVIGISHADENRIISRKVTIKFSNGEKTIKVKNIVQINEANAVEDYGEFNLDFPYNGKIKDVEIEIISPNSKHKKFHHKDATVYTNQTTSTLASDAKYYHWDIGKVPANSRIEYYYEIELKDASYGSFVNAMSSLAVDTTSIIVYYDSDKWRLKYSKDNDEVRCIAQNEPMVFRWYYLPRLKDSDYKDAPRDMCPGLWYAFESLDGKDDFSEWSDIYEWSKDYYENNSKFGTPDILLGMADTAEDIFYEIMKKCRYIAVEIDEGRFCPPSPEDIWRNGYGDCKGLSHIFVSWLKLAGYEAWPVLVYTKSDKIGNPDFPSPYVFNHVIAAFVDESGDTVYQDMTTKRLPYGYFPITQYGAFALPLVPGCQSIRLSYSPKWPDTVTCTLEGVVDVGGNLSGKLNTVLTGRQAFTLEWLDNYSSEHDIEVTAYKYIEQSIPRAHIENVSYNNQESSKIKLSADVTVSKFAYCKDSLVMFRPNVFELSHLDVSPDSSCSWPVTLRRNIIENIEFRVLADSCKFNNSVDSVSYEGNGYSYNYINRSHSDSLILDYSYYCYPDILQPEEFIEYCFKINTVKKSFFRNVKGHKSR